METTYIISSRVKSFEIWVNELIIIEAGEGEIKDQVDTAKVILTTAQNLQLITALETAQKELDPSYQTREELITQLTELAGKANG